VYRRRHFLFRLVEVLAVLEDVGAADEMLARLIGQPRRVRQPVDGLKPPHARIHHRRPAQPRRFRDGGGITGARLVEPAGFGGQVAGGHLLFDLLP